MVEALDCWEAARGGPGGRSRSVPRSGSLTPTYGVPGYCRRPALEGESAGRCRSSAETTVRDVAIDDDRISFTTEHVGLPHLIRISHFPNWRATGAEGPYLAAPWFMVVVPTHSEVSLEFGPTWVELTGLVHDSGYGRAPPPRVGLYDGLHPAQASVESHMSRASNLEALADRLARAMARPAAAVAIVVLILMSFVSYRPPADPDLFARVAVGPLGGDQRRRRASRPIRLYGPPGPVGRSRVAGRSGVLSGSHNWEATRRSSP